MPGDDITLGELSRGLVSLEERINRRFDDVNRRLETQAFVHRETYAVEIKNLTDRVEELEQSNKWLARSLATAFLFAFLAPVLVAWVVTR